MMEKFILTNIVLKRKSPKPIKHKETGISLAMQEELLTITLEYIGSGDTIKITNEQLMNKIKTLLGGEI